MRLGFICMLNIVIETELGFLREAASTGKEPKIRGSSPTSRDARRIFD